MTTLGGFDLSIEGYLPPTGSQINIPGGTMGTGRYTYKMTLGSEFGETLATAESAPVTVSIGNAVQLNIPPAEPRVASRRIYRSLASADGSGPWYHVLTIGDATTRRVIDRVSDELAVTHQTTPDTDFSSSIQDIKGWTAFTKPVIESTEWGIEATGSSISDGRQLTATNNIVTVTPVNAGVNLPPLNHKLIGITVMIRNNGSRAIKVYPYDDGETQIDGNSTSTGVNLSTGTTMRLLAARYTPESDIRYKWNIV